MRSNWLRFAGVCLVVVLASSGFAGQWRVRLSPTYAWDMEMRVSGSSYSQGGGGLSLPGASGVFDRMTVPGYRPTAVDLELPDDNITQYGDRWFDDGFVVRDLGTEDPQALPPGVTMYWGYASKTAQYDSDGRTLTFRRAGMTSLTGSDADVLAYTRKRVAVETVLDTAVSGKDRFGMPGVDIAVSYDADRKIKGFGFGFSMGVSGYWHGKPQVTARSYRGRVTESQYRETVRDDYDYTLSQNYMETYAYGDPGETLSNLPEVYAGADQGDPWAVGPVIPNLPVSRDLTTESALLETVFMGQTQGSVRTGERGWGELYNQVDVGATIDRYVLWLGGSVEREIASVATVYLRPRVSLSYLDGEATRGETLFLLDHMGRSSTSASWYESESISHWSLGVGLSGGVDVPLGEHWSLGLGGGVEWLENDVSLDIGPNHVAIDMDNLHATVTVACAL